MKQIPAFPPIPESEEELIAIFGNIRDYIPGSGTISPAWEEKFITRIQLPGAVPYAFDDGKMITRITVHVALADVAVALFESIWRRGLSALLGPYGGGYVYRRNKNDPNKLSLHSYGLAWDWDPFNFPNGSKKRRDPRLVAEFERFGFMCGQDFKGTKDPMHFQLGRNI